MDRPEEDSHLGPGYVHSRHDYQQWEHELQESHGRNKPELSPHIERVKICAVDDTEPHPTEEQYEVPMVEMAHAIPSKHTVVLSLEYANPTHRAVPGSGW